MKFDYLSSPSYVTMDAMNVIGSIRISENPEEEIISLMHHFADANHITIEREFGFDCPVDEDSGKQGHRGYCYWLAVPEIDIIRLFGEKENLNYNGNIIEKRHIGSYKYATLTIEDPFADPFDRIPKGWKKLAAWIEKDGAVDCGASDSDIPCLEEILEENGKIVMRIYIAVRRL